MISASRFAAAPHSALALLAFGLIAGASAGMAAVPPLINKGTWIESKSASCQDKISCFVEFTPVPAGRTLIARNVSCRIHTLNYNTFTDYLVLGGNARSSYLNAGPPMNSNNRIYVMNSRIFVPFLPAAKPRITYKLLAVGFETSISIACTLSGELKP